MTEYPPVTSQQPKIGLALSGAASRSVFYIGFLESMDEAGVVFDYIAACSSGCIVAASYACGTLPILKEQALALNKEIAFSLLEKSKHGGYYNLDRFEDALRIFTNNKNFEDVRPLMGFVSVDINKGEQVVLNMGDLAHAARISCTLPGIFEPVQWGSRTLIDGGLLNILPVDVALAAGMDKIVGINMSGTKHIFTKNQQRARRVMKAIRRLLLFDRAGRLWQRLLGIFDQSDFLNYFPSLEDIDKERPGMFAVLGRSLDLVIEAEKRNDFEKLRAQCDIFIRPEFDRLRMTNFSQTETLYNLGRKMGRAYAPQILALRKQKQPEPLAVHDHGII